MNGPNIKSKSNSNFNFKSNSNSKWNQLNQLNKVNMNQFRLNFFLIKIIIKKKYLS